MRNTCLNCVGKSGASSREKNGKRRQKRRYAVSTDIRSRAIQTF
jgi:hypothetical protein